VVHNRTAIKGLLNGSIDYKAPDRRWDLRLWARNLTDTRYGAPSNFFLGLAQAFGYAGTYYTQMAWNPPRTVGATLTYQLRWPMGRACGRPVGLGDRINTCPERVLTS
jgi:outer membrane receptor protein involved in Fe transport